MTGDRAARFGVGVLLLALLTSCSSGDEGTGSEDGGGGAAALEIPKVEEAVAATMPAFELAAPEEFYRLDLRLGAGGVELDAMERGQFAHSAYAVGLA